MQPWQPDVLVLGQLHPCEASGWEHEVLLMLMDMSLLTRVVCVTLVTQ